MYDGLTARYTFSCPTREEARIRLSSFRTLERLPGAAHPAVYGVRFSCNCGEVHSGLVTHDELDWPPLGLAARASFYNVMTGRLESAAPELADQAAHRIRRGAWPWSFFCFAEARPRPVFPSAFRIVAPGGGRLVVFAALPPLPSDLRQPRVAGACRRPLLLGPGGRSDRARLRARRRGAGGGACRRAGVRRGRRGPARAGGLGDGAG